MLFINLPAMDEGVPYKECVTLTGTQPFTLIKHNLGTAGTAQIVGDQLCIDIPSPVAFIDFAATVATSCDGCAPETVVAEIDFSPVGVCECVSATISPQTMPPLVSGQYFGTLILNGTAPFELCGGSAPRCLKIELKGNLVTVSGRYDGNGDVVFSVKNACTCDCLTYIIEKA